MTKSLIFIKNAFGYGILSMGLLLGISTQVAYAGPVVGYGDGYSHNQHGYHGGGYEYYGRGYHHYRYRPNVIINVPGIPYYIPHCRDIRICNYYGDCWIENTCN
ncbi:MAG: hypothetical protein H0U75_04425 [Legionella sp.]|nr:hypothetical protein [Legionella sp.]